MAAAEKLGKEGIDARVIDSSCLKPLDEETVLMAAEETGAVVTVENNMIYGGLGSAVAELLAQNNPTPMEMIGVLNRFAESGPYLEIIEKYGLTSPYIIEAAKKVLKRKK